MWFARSRLRLSEYDIVRGNVCKVDYRMLVFSTYTECPSVRMTVDLTNVFHNWRSRFELIVGEPNCN